MTDQQRLAQLIESQHPCIAMVTADEPHALSVVRMIAMELGCELRLWAISQGWHDGLSATREPVGRLRSLRGAQHIPADLGRRWRLARVPRA